MKVILWCQEQPNFNVLTVALQNLAQRYGNVIIVGAISKWGGVLVSGDKPLPTIDKNQISAQDYDIIVVTGNNASLTAVIDEVRDLNIDAEKIILDRTVCIYGFSLELYKKLRHANLSIISMNNFGALIGQTFGLPNAGVNFSFAERDFLKFLKNPLHYLKFELRLYKTSPRISFLLGDIELQSGYSDVESARTAFEDWRLNFNPFNALAIMYTEKPEVLAEFDKLPYAKKICFTPFETDLDAGFYIKPFYVGGRSFEAAVNKIAVNQHVCYNVWNILLRAEKSPVNLHSKAVGKDIHQEVNFSSSDGRIHFFNWSPSPKNPSKNFFTRFIEAVVTDKKEFNIFAVFGDPRLIRAANVKNKIFYTGEEVFTWPWYDGYQDYFLDAVDLALGYEYIKHENYIRFPYWMYKNFEPKLDIDVIRNRIAEINNARNTKKYKCVLISSHDMMNTRTPIYERLKDILQIKCAGSWNHNTDELQTVYNDDKRKYVHEFMFNICPENVNHFGYVTEKLFDAFEAGAIPIYHGSDNNPEEGIVNKDAVLFWTPNSDNDALVKEIVRLKTDEDYYEKFMRQEKLHAKAAADYIYTTFEELAKKLRAMK